MYGNGAGGLTAVVPVGGGIALLPNTGGDPLLLAVSILSITVGVLIILTTIARIIAKRYYKA
ncbi:MAG: hypothetical protein ABIQ04_02810 [Candidatus Saccharimonadales bacterium]